MWALVALSAALLVLAGAVLFAELRTPARWDPLGAYPTQQVTNPRHRVHLEGLVRVEATKCADEEVQVRGVLSWQAMDPPGANIEVGSGTATRAKGCSTFAFANPVPVEVREVIEAQHAAGIARPVWRVTGTETPFDDNREGAPRTWVTDNFEVVP